MTHQPSLQLYTPRFRIKPEYLCSVPNELICEQTKHGSNYSYHGTLDHPSFTSLRQHLAYENLIHMEKGWVNGDRVLEKFYLNDVLFQPGERFLSASAIAHTIERGEKHPMPKPEEPQYDAELRDWCILPAYLGGLVATGRVYKDSKGRFHDGELIRTSLVKDVQQGILITQNTRYKLVSRR